MKEKTPEQVRQIYSYMIPDLLGEPLGGTTGKGVMVFPKETEIPPDSFIFFIPIDEWNTYKMVKE